MSENTKLWDILARTDPKHTSNFKRGGGFSGTAIKPIWSIKRMTEEFGPCGKGWGIAAPDFQLVPAGEEILVFCTVSLWYAIPSEGKEEDTYTVVGVGGDKVMGKNKYGAFTDDEAFKKAFTDATTNAMKMIGIGADVHMGLFEDSKYVQSMKKEFADDGPVQSSAELKRSSSWPQFAPELAEVSNEIQLSNFVQAWRKIAIDESWNSSFKKTAKDLIDGKRAELAKPVEDDDTFPGDKPNAYEGAFRAG
jgi:hypothetical protein